MKQAREIYENMRKVFREKTGTAVGEQTDVSVRLLAAAAELESLYGYCDWAMNQSFPQTAAGEYLDLHAKLRGLRREDARAAEGKLRFFVQRTQEQDVSVPAGTVCTDAALLRFVTTEDGVIPAGQLHCEVAARAELPGPSGNAAAGTVTRMPQPPVGVVSCDNPMDFFGGTEQEDDETLRGRVLGSFSRLPNGANAAFYEQRAKSVDGVAGVEVLPRKRGVGTVDVVVSAMSGVPEEELLARVQADLESVREISVDVLVSSPETEELNLALTVWPADGVAGETAIAAAEAAIQGFFHGGLLGKAVYLAQLGNRVFTTGKVKNYLFTSPAEDLAAKAGVLPVLGSLTVTEGL